MKKRYQFIVVAASLLSLATTAQNESNIIILNPPPSPVTTKVDFKAEAEKWEKKYGSKRKELESMRKLEAKSAAERRMLTMDVTRLEKEAKEYYDEWQKYEEKYYETVIERDDLAIKYSEAREELIMANKIIKLKDSVLVIYDSINVAKDRMINYLEAEVVHLKAVRNDHVDTETNEITIGMVSAPYKKAGEVNGFSPNSSKLPPLTTIELDNIERLISLVEQHNMKVELIGTCKYGDMNIAAAKGLALRRAATVRDFLINTFGLRSDMVEIIGTTNCDVCNTVKIKVQD